MFDSEGSAPPGRRQTRGMTLGADPDDFVEIELVNYQFDRFDNEWDANWLN